MFSSNMFSSNMFSSMFTRDRGFMFFRSIFHYTIKLSSHHRSHNEFAVFFKMLARQRQRIHIGRFQKHRDLSYHNCVRVNNCDCTFPSSLEPDRPSNASMSSIMTRTSVSLSDKFTCY